MNKEYYYNQLDGTVRILNEISEYFNNVLSNTAYKISLETINVHSISKDIKPIEVYNLQLSNLMVRFQVHYFKEETKEVIEIVNLSKNLYTYDMHKFDKRIINVINELSDSIFNIIEKNSMEHSKYLFDIKNNINFPIYLKGLYDTAQFFRTLAIIFCRNNEDICNEQSIRKYLTKLNKELIF